MGEFCGSFKCGDLAAELIINLTGNNKGGKMIRGERLYKFLINFIYDKE